MMSESQEQDPKVFESSIYKRFKMNSHKILLEKPKDLKQKDNQKNKENKLKGKELLKKFNSNTGIYEKLVYITNNYF